MTDALLIYISAQAICLRREKGEQNRAVLPALQENNFVVLLQDVLLENFR